MRYSDDEISWDDDQAVIGPDGEPVTGEVVFYGPLGEIEAVVGYHKGFKNGVERRYHHGGSLKYEGEWTWGRGVGVHRKWHPNGQLSEELYFDNGLRRVLRWHEDGTSIEEP